MHFHDICSFKIIVLSWHSVSIVVTDVRNVGDNYHKSPHLFHYSCLLVLAKHVINSSQVKHSSKKFQNIVMCLLLQVSGVWALLVLTDKPDLRPALIKILVGNFHYLHFCFLCCVVTFIVGISVSMVTEPIPPECVSIHLQSSTLSQYSTLFHNDMDYYKLENILML